MARLRGLEFQSLAKDEETTNDGECIDDSYQKTRTDTRDEELQVSLLGAGIPTWEI